MKEKFTSANGSRQNGYENDVRRYLILYYIIDIRIQIIALLYLLVKVYLVTYSQHCNQYSNSSERALKNYF